MATIDEVTKEALFHQGREYRYPKKPSFIRAFFVAIGKAFKHFGNAWDEFRYSYRKQREFQPAYLAKVPVPDAYEVLGQVGFEQEAESVKSDEPLVHIYRTESGKYYTRAQLEALNGKTVPEIAAIKKAGGYVPTPGERITYAEEISDERATVLVEQLEALSLDHILDEGHQTLLLVLKKALAEKWV